MSNPCISCGACCASFRVSFYWNDGQVPPELTSPVNQYLVAMRGTEQKPVRCCALQGEIGQAVSCSIYTQRSSTCQSVMVGDEQCNKARVIHGLPVLM